MGENANTIIRQLLDTVADPDNGVGQVSAKVTTHRNGKAYQLEIVVTELDENGQPNIDPDA